MGKKRKAHDDRIDNCSRKKPRGRQAPSHVTDLITWSAYTTISSKQHEVDACTDNETRIDECQDNVINELINGPFLQNTSQKTREDCIKGYIHRTSNVELAQHACMVWARLLFAFSKMTEVHLDEPPNIHLLKPTHPHPEHVLHMGSLLHNDVLDNNGSSHVCNDCSRHLRIGQMPPLTLANNMWIGKVPFELSILSLAEHVLIAQHLPCTYLVKLYPKAEQWLESDAVYLGLKGNISTHPLNTSHIAGLVSANVLLPQAQVLSTVIGITFVSP